MSSPINITGTFESIFGVADLTGTLTWTLCNVGSVSTVPSGSPPVILSELYGVVTAVGGAFSFTIWGNDVIASAGVTNSYYNVKFESSDGDFAASVDYLFTGAGPLNLATWAPLNLIPAPAVPLPGNAVVTNPTGIQTILVYPLVINSNLTVGGTIQTTSEIDSGTLSVSGVATFVNEVITGTLTDGFGAVGTSGQLLSSTGSLTKWVTPSAGSSSFSAMTSGTNTVAVMVVGTGASLGVSGTGTITATQVNAVVISGTPTAGMELIASSSTAAAWSARVVQANYVIDGGGIAITTGAKGQLNIGFPCTITGWVITADQSGSAVVDVLTSTYAGFPSTSSIASTDKPTLASAQKNENLAVSVWTTALAAGTQLQFNVNSAATVTRLNITLLLTRP